MDSSASKGAVADLAAARYRLLAGVLMWRLPMGWEKLSSEASAPALSRIMGDPVGGPVHWAGSKESSANTWIAHCESPPRRAECCDSVCCDSGPASQSCSSAAAMLSLSSGSLASRPLINPIALISQRHSLPPTSTADSETEQEVGVVLLHISLLDPFLDISGALEHCHSHLQAARHPRQKATPLSTCCGQLRSDR